MAIRGRRYPARRLPLTTPARIPNVIHPITTVTETDTAFALGRAKAKAILFATETDTALVLGAAKAKTIGGPVTETDTAFALGRAKARTLDLATESDTPRVFGKAKAKTIAAASETDTAWPITATTGKSIALAVAHETDTAWPITPTMTHSPYKLHWWFKQRAQHPPYWSEERGT